MQSSRSQEILITKTSKVALRAWTAAALRPFMLGVILFDETC
jgi:hypothetical protein